jgi:poly(hydroxyalkanoate) depolymerase family esterase
MTNLFNQTLLKATQMTRSGHLMDATRLIQQALSGAPPAAANDAQVMDKDVIDVQARDVTPRPDLAEPVQAQPVHAADPIGQPSSQAVPAPDAPGRFIQDEFVFAGSTYLYRLYVPSVTTTADGQPAAMPLVVLLHGCTQNALDFATGTAMNELANEQGCLVLYPQQTAKGNAQLCWNWFEPGHQVAGRGEPGMIAALTRHILAQPAGHYQTSGQPQGVADASRVYIAGLSAGGAMAAVVAGLCPDLFAAVGVHSGLPSGAAHDMLSALKAMGRGAPGKAAAALPTIVFHGSADKTVHPVNGDSISGAAAAALGDAGVALVQSHDAPDVGQARRKAAKRTRHSDAQGTPFVEQWRVAAGPHAWSGGNAAGSYTDPDGPSASRAMLDFFLQHRKA